MTLTFQLDTPPNTKVEVTIPDQSVLDEFVEACRAGAFALGYDIDSITQSFKTSEELDLPEPMAPLEEDY